MIRTRTTLEEEKESQGGMDEEEEILYSYIYIIVQFLGFNLSLSLSSLYPHPFVRNITSFFNLCKNASKSLDRFRTFSSCHLKLD